MIQKNRNEWLLKIKNKEAIWKEACPFCDIKEERIIKEFDFWIILQNKYPYNWYTNHLMAIPKKHRELTSDLSLIEIKEFKKVSIFMKKYYNKENYFSFIRETNWWKSIKHLHYHYLPWILYSTKLESII